MSITGGILSKISEGKTLGELSNELYMRESTARAIIESMLHQGYLEGVKCRGGCRTCPMNCGSPPSSKIKIYTLTEKGMECIEGTQIEM